MILLHQEIVSSEIILLHKIFWDEFWLVFSLHRWHVNEQQEIIKKKKIPTPKALNIAFSTFLICLSCRFLMSEKPLWWEREKIVFLYSNRSVTTEVWRTGRLYSHIRIWFALQINLVLSHMTSNTSQDISSQSLIPELAEQSQIPLLDAVRIQSILLTAGLFRGL